MRAPSVEEERLREFVDRGYADALLRRLFASRIEQLRGALLSATPLDERLRVGYAYSLGAIKDDLVSLYETFKLSPPAWVESINK